MRIEGLRETGDGREMSGRRRNAGLNRMSGGESRERIYQKKCIGQKSIGEDGPADPTARTAALIERLAEHQGDDDADEFVARIGHEVEQLRLVADGQKIAAELEGQDLDDDDRKGRRGR